MYYDGEDAAPQFDFTEKSIRLGFIRKVYGILLCQMLITVAFIAILLFHEPTQIYCRYHPWVWWTSFGIFFVTLIAMSCSTNARRKAPMNFIFLFLFTCSFSFFLASAASTYEVQEVLIAAGITAGLCLALTLFAFQTKWDFTVMGGMLFVALFVLIIFGIFAAIFQSKVATIGYASLGAFLFSAYLVFDTQLMIGGKHKYSLSPEEYVFAALNLYLDIINIFMYILAIIGLARN